MMASRAFVICGNLVHATDDDPMVVMQDKCLGVKDNKVNFEFVVR